MTNIIDFIKHKADREVEEYLGDTELEEGEIMCYGCPECQNHTFMLTLEKDIICAECGDSWGVEG